MAAAAVTAGGALAMMGGLTELFLAIGPILAFLAAILAPVILLITSFFKKKKGDKEANKEEKK